MVAMGIYRIDGLNPSSFTITAGAMALSSGIFEEKPFRGVLFFSLEHGFGSWITLVVSSLVSWSGPPVQPASDLGGRAVHRRRGRHPDGSGGRADSIALAGDRSPRGVESHAASDLLRHPFGQRCGSRPDPLNQRRSRLSDLGPIWRRIVSAGPALLHHHRSRDAGLGGQARTDRSALVEAHRLRARFRGRVASSTRASPSNPSRGE